MTEMYNSLSLNCKKYLGLVKSQQPLCEYYFHFTSLKAHSKYVCPLSDHAVMIIQWQVTLWHVTRS